MDDIDYVRRTDMETGSCLSSIAHRYECGGVLITSNLPYSQWDVAAIDWLVHHAQIIKLTGERYRKRHSINANSELRAPFRAPPPC